MHLFHPPPPESGLVLVFLSGCFVECKGLWMNKKGHLFSNSCLSFQEKRVKQI
uniref:Uncharacterized protein n=1 Tax=Anguilla anguilla TaxID=7936 RepID=A0A0E9PEY8_ANGAN